MRYMWRYIVWLIAVVGLVIIMIMLLLPGNSKKTMSGQSFIGYASSSATISMMIDGPQGADSTHQAVKIIVGENQVVYEQLSGYNYNVKQLKTFESNQNAYNVFLRSLYHAGFLNGDTDPNQTNPYGICPLGDTYTYDFTYNNSTIEHFWRTTCGNKTYNGNFSLTNSIFENQVPNFNGLSLNIAF